MKGRLINGTKNRERSRNKKVLDLHLSFPDPSKDFETDSNWWGNTVNIYLFICLSLLFHVHLINLIYFAYFTCTKTSIINKACTGKPLTTRGSRKTIIFSNLVLTARIITQFRSLADINKYGQTNNKWLYFLKINLLLQRNTNIWRIFLIWSNRPKKTRELQLTKGSEPFTQSEFSTKPSGSDVGFWPACILSVSKYILISEHVFNSFFI